MKIDNKVIVKVKDREEEVNLNEENVIKDV